MIMVMADDNTKDAEKQSGKELEGESVLEGEVVLENPDNPENSEDSDRSEESVKPEELEVPEVSDGDDQAELVMKLEGMIRNNNSQIAKLASELSETREMLKDAFENDTTYREHADAAKDANKVKAATRAQILKQPAVKALADKTKTLSSELKELKEGLSDYLREFNRLSGITEIEGDDGELLQIVYVAKLVKKTR